MVFRARLEGWCSAVLLECWCSAVVQGCSAVNSVAHAVLQARLQHGVGDGVHGRIPPEPGTSEPAAAGRPGRRKTEKRFFKNWGRGPPSRGLLHPRRAERVVAVVVRGAGIKMPGSSMERLGVTRSSAPWRTVAGGKIIRRRPSSMQLLWNDPQRTCL